MPNSEMHFEPTRVAALERLRSFAPRSGSQYAAGRNTDDGQLGPSAVSRLSPYIRFRILTECEVVACVLEHHSLPDADKFVQEVLWRTYWKGWLQMRPSVWTRFQQERDEARDSFPDTSALAAAERGETGIDGFDDWAKELIATGYLHNHARMWFASIWIFTLRLPWTLGADFFLRHLFDADAASNTLSWRWVAGLQTASKTYLATADNIARYTNGRYAPVGLASDATPLSEAPLPAAQDLPKRARPAAGERALLLVTSDDMHPESWQLDEIPIAAVAVAADRNLLWGERAHAFAAAAASDAAGRAAAQFACPAQVIPVLQADALLSASRAADVRQIVTGYAPVGPVADRVASVAGQLASEGFALRQLPRAWDEQFWPHARKGFFPFRKRIPDILRAKGMI